MTESMALGASDARARWVGVRRDQVALVVCGVGLVGDWTLRASASMLEAVLGVFVLVLASPVGDGVIVVEWCAAALTFLGRRRWTSVTLTRGRGDARIVARGAARFEDYELEHRGRLDLSGADDALVASLGALCDGLATTSGIHHVSLHVREGADATSTMLALPFGASAPEGWRHRDGAPGRAGESRQWLLERWSYLRDLDGVLTVLRVEDFGAGSGPGALERLQRTAQWSELALHLEVLGGERAQRLAARAVHATRSDAAAASTAGFRRSARAQRHVARLAERETLVAGGRALMRVAVYVVVRGRDLDEVKGAVIAFARDARAAGLRCRRGAGRQALWYCAQLAGGPGW